MSGLYQKRRKAARVKPRALIDVSLMLIFLHSSRCRFARETMNMTLPRETAVKSESQGFATIRISKDGTVDFTGKAGDDGGRDANGAGSRHGQKGHHCVSSAPHGTRPAVVNQAMDAAPKGLKEDKAAVPVQKGNGKC